MSDISQWPIILVDDEADSLDLLSDVLSLNGAEAYRASNGEACLALLEVIMPRVIVLDLNMPRPDGWDMLAEIRAMPRLSDVPVVAITAYYSDTVEREAHRAGFDAFMRKPIKSGEFLALIRTLGRQ